jgi:L-threonylcarbamoyladenylate synthase
MIINYKQALEILENGGIIIFPTDTAFGIGCRIDNSASVSKLFDLRKRPTNKAVPVLFGSIAQVKEYVLPFDSHVEELMKKYWPGALTLVLNCKTDKVNSLVRGGGESLGVRIPNDVSLVKLINDLGVPIVGTSANFAGEKTPYKYEDLNLNLLELVDGVLMGETKEETASTFVDCTKKPWKILREGAINLNL